MTQWNQNTMWKKIMWKGSSQKSDSGPREINYKYVSGYSSDAYNVYAHIKKPSPLQVADEIGQKARKFCWITFKNLFKKSLKQLSV